MLAQMKFYIIPVLPAVKLPLHHLAPIYVTDVEAVVDRMQPVMEQILSTGLFLTLQLMAADVPWTMVITVAVPHCRKQKKATGHSLDGIRISLQQKV